MFNDLLAMGAGGGSGSLTDVLDKNHYFWNYSNELVAFEDSISIDIGGSGALVFNIRERNYVTVTGSSIQKIATNSNGDLLSLSNSTKTNIQNYEWLVIFRASSTTANFSLTFSDT